MSYVLVIASVDEVSWGVREGRGTTAPLTRPMGQRHLAGPTDLRTQGSGFLSGTVPPLPPL